MRVLVMLLLLANADFRDHWRDRPDFLVISPLETEPARLAKGTDGSVLQVTAGAVGWSDVISGGTY